jgi:hypothetical protein
VYIDDGAQTEFLAATIQEREQAASVISVPMGYYDAFNWAKRRS